MEGGAGADADGDGVVNVLECALGGHPQVADAGKVLPVAVRVVGSRPTERGAGPAGREAVPDCSTGAAARAEPGDRWERAGVAAP